MSYTPATDFVGLWRAISGGVQKGEIPGLDFVVAALGRAGLLSVSVSGTQPVANQATTAWFQPASPSYSAEGALYLWNATASAYQAATPALFRQFLEVSFGASGASWFSTTGGPPSNTVGSNGDFAIRTDVPGGIYGPKASGVWPGTALPGTSYSQVSSALDYAFGSPAQGSVLFRGAAGWQVLSPGASGSTLTTQGAGANPTWTALANTVNSAAIDAAFGSATGNMLYRSSGGWQSLAIGPANAMLRANGTTPYWDNLSSFLDATMGAAQGALLFRNATQWTTIAPGTNGYLLQSGGAGGNPSWAAPSVASVNSGALDTAFGNSVGGVLVRGTGGWVNSGAGTAGYALTANGGGAAPTWQAVPGPPAAGAVGSYALGDGTHAFDPSGSFYAGTWAVVSQLAPNVYAGGAGGGGAGFGSIYLMKRTA